MEKYIPIVEVNHGTDELRPSTLVDQGVDKGLRIMGNLPHGYAFEPESRDAAEALIDWLQDWIQQEAR